MRNDDYQHKHVSGSEADEKLADRIEIEDDAFDPMDIYNSQSVTQEDWEVLIKRGKAALNNFALRHYREAPFVQWAAISLDHAIRLVEHSFDASAEYLKLTVNGINYAKRLMYSPYSNLIQEDESFENELSYRAFRHILGRLEMAHNEFLQYRQEPKAEYIEVAKTQLKEGLIEVIIADRRIRKTRP